MAVLDRYAYILESLQELSPGCKFSVDGETLDGIEWFDDNPTPQPSDEAIKTEHAKQVLLAESKMYQHDRYKSYPRILDQLDMLWHAIDDGALDKTSDFYIKLKKVKDDNPK